MHSTHVYAYLGKYLYKCIHCFVTNSLLLHQHNHDVIVNMNVKGASVLHQQAKKFYVYIHGMVRCYDS